MTLSAKNNNVILLINPPWYVFWGGGFDQIPVGLCYLSSYIKKYSNWSTFIYNADFPITNDYQLKASEMHDNSVKYLENLNNLNHDSWKKIRIQIKTIKPDIVGIHIKTGSYKSALLCAKLIKEENPKIKIICGGPHASVDPNGVIHNKNIDFVIRGEGEKTLLELLKVYTSNKNYKDIKGLTYRYNGKIYSNPNSEYIQNLDEIPFPDRDSLIQKDKYSKEGLGILFTSRGCPFECTYCASKKIWGRKVRFRSVNNVIDEIRLLKEKYNVNHLKIRDDTFTLNQKRLLDICRIIIKDKMNITWHCDTRADCLTEKSIRMMKKAGCTSVSIGVESGSQKILDDIKKGESLETIKNTINIMHRYGIHITIFLMIGFKNETLNDVKETIKLMKKLNPTNVVASILTPYPGTDIYKNAPNSIKSIAFENYYHQSPEMGLWKDRLSFELAKKYFFNEIELYKPTFNIAFRLKRKISLLSLGL